MYNCCQIHPTWKSHAGWRQCTKFNFLCSTLWLNRNSTKTLQENKCISKLLLSWFWNCFGRSGRKKRLSSFSKWLAAIIVIKPILYPFIHAVTFLKQAPETSLLLYNIKIVHHNITSRCVCLQCVLYHLKPVTQGSTCWFSQFSLDFDSEIAKCRS